MGFLQKLTKKERREAARQLHLQQQQQEQLLQQQRQADQQQDEPLQNRWSSRLRKVTPTDCQICILPLRHIPLHSR